MNSKSVSPPSAYAAALRMLSARALSEKEVYDRLVQRDYSAQQAADAVSRCREAGFLDDRQYAQMLVRRYGSRSGARMILTKLYEHGIDRETAQEALESWETPDLDALLLRQLRGKTDEASLRRAGAALYRRGFSSGQIRSTIERFRDAFPEETET